MVPEASVSKAENKLTFETVDIPQDYVKIGQNLYFIEKFSSSRVKTN